MSRLDRLQIRGIRSFGPEPEDVGEIKFQSPLTLILGQNGCGKTTIIEALKFAICSEQPPNSKGKKGGSAFVHDPKLGNSSETMASIKLRIFDVHNKSVVVSRTMKNMQKLKSMEFKTIDQTITYDKNTISNRCIDTDEQMCNFIGVSKPILNYVIFCHQEQSCWPMEEGKSVKDRFDQIFDADKYNKCLEKIRKMRSKRVTENRLTAKDVAYLKENWETALQYKEKLETEQAKLVACENTMEACARELSKVEDKLKVVKKKEMNMTQLIAEKTADKKILESLKKSLDEIVEGLPMGEFAGSDEELEEAIKSFNLDFEEKKKKLQEIEAQIKNMDSSEKLMQSKLSTQQVKLGKLKRDQDAYKDMVQQRNDAFNKLAMAVGISDSGPSTPGSSCTSFDTSMEEVEEKIRELRAEVERQRGEADRREKSEQDGVDAIRREQAKLEQTKQLKADQLSKAKIDMKKVVADLEEVGQSSKNLTALDNRLKRVVAEIKSESEGVDVSAMDSEIKTLQTKITEIEDEMLEVNKEIDDLIEVSNLQTSLDSCVERKAAIDTEVDRLKAKTQDILKHLLKEIPEKNVKNHLDLYLSNLTHNITSTQKRIAEKQTDLTKLESKRQHTDEKLRTSRRTLLADEEELQNICLDQDYEEVVNSTTEALKRVQDDTGTLKSSMIMFRKYIAKLQEPRPCCPLCTRTFNADQEALELARSLETKLENVPRRLVSSTEEQNRLEEKLTRLQQLRPVYQRVSQLKDTDLPQLNEELSVVSEQIKALTEEIAAVEGDLEIGLKQDENLARGIQVDVINLDQKMVEARNIEKEIENLRAQIPTTGSTLPQARSKREELQEKLESARKSVESIQAKKTSHVNKINKLTTDQNEIVKEQLKVEKGVQQMKQLVDKKSELKELESSLSDQIEKLSNEEFPIKQKLEAAEREKNEHKRTSRNAIERENNKLKSIEQQSVDVQKLNSKVLQFERQKISQQLEEMEKEISQLTRTIDSRAQNKVTLLSQKDMAKADISNQDARHRDLNDNKNLRKKRKEAEQLEKRLNDLETNIGDLDFEQIINESAELEFKYENLKEKKNQAFGTKREIESKVKEVKADLAKPQFKNALKDYKEKLIDHKVAEAVIKDLGAYYLAMDWALKKTHNERMRTINVIIRDLWRNIYVGNDIDYIEIKTSEDEITDADKRRDFNYRVVQVKNGIELDMRGRCSAGQKILASIIIRLALAETFSTNCGVITLDEPTTNLDRDNVVSLCNALINLVSSRSTQKHFQMVIITHDEDFIARLTREEKVNCFWKVYRDNKGLSKIIKCDPIRINE